MIVENEGVGKVFGTLFGQQIARFQGSFSSVVWELSAYFPGESNI